MEPISFQTSWVLGWLFDSTICISVLICLILTIKAVTKGKLPAWWSYGLWLLLLLRMLMPWGIESRMSVFNYLPAPLANESYMPFLTERDLSIPLIRDHFDAAKTTILPTSTDADVVKEPANRYYDDYNSKESNRFHFSLSLDSALLILWFTGVMLFGIRVLSKNLVFWMLIRRLPSAKDEVFLDLFEKCKLSLAIRKNIAVIVTDHVKSPALFGYFKPRLLLPPHFLDTLQKDELRYVFLHELSHLKRHDICVSWLVTVLQIVHWFNPFVWYAFHHLRVDQEAACDAYVLSRIKQIQPADYANTIVSLLESFIQNRQLPSLVGIMENKSQIRRRIAMIINFKRYALQTKCALILMLFIVGLLFLTGSSGKADAEKTKIAGEFKESQVVRPNDGPVSNRHDNKVSPTEDEKELYREIAIVPSNKMVKSIGMKEEADTNLAEVDTKYIKTQVDPLTLIPDNQEEILSGNRIPEVEELESEPATEPSEAIQLQQDSPVDHTDRGLSHQKKGQIDDAISDYNKAMEINPKFAAAYENRDISDSKEPSTLPEKYDLDDELEAVDQIFSVKGPRVHQVDNQSVILRVNWRDYYLLVLRRPFEMMYSDPNIGLARAIPTVTAGVDRVFVTPSDSTTGYVIEKIYKLKGREQAEEIKERFREDVEKPQDSSVDRISQGLSHLHKGQIDDAFTDFNRAIDVDPGNSEAHFSRGAIYYMQGQIEKAISDYNKAIELNPEFTAAYQNRGCIYYSIDEYDRAISDFDKALALNDEDAATYNMRGIAYYRQGQIEKAISDYNKAIELNPEFAAAYQNRGFLYQEKRMNKDALSDYDKALELDPENANIYFYRGLIYSSELKFGKAKSEFDKVIALNPEAAIAEVAKEYRSRARFGSYSASNYTGRSSLGVGVQTGMEGWNGFQTWGSSLAGKTGPPWPDYRP
jgi:beta-lactamase regulating signal transducer with metallopeptidase domain/tetratricopeptide (TPR) repeat protein